MLVYLFSDESEKGIQFRRAAISGAAIPPPATKLDVVQRIWERTLPHRELVISGGKVETQVKGKPSNVYNAAEMSDGERVIFYLIGQCLSAPLDSIIIIDEPKLHLHKSIRAKLWDEIECHRKDCMFVYLTHDLDFASTRVNAKKIWLKSFDGSSWEWDVVPETDAIPEDLMLSILGSRKPIIFIEGDRTSWDFFLFSHLYPGYTVVPAGNCEAVIHATCSFAAMHMLHSLNCYGIIDRDYRTYEQLAYFKTLNIHSLDISEIENLVIIEDVLRAIAFHLKRSGEADTLFEKYKNTVLAEMATEQERVVSFIAASEIEALFKTFNNKAAGQLGLAASLSDTLSKIDITAIYGKAENRVNAILSNRDYREAIKLYNNKGLIPKAAQLFGMKSDVFQNYIKSLIIDPDTSDVITAIRTYAPNLKLSWLVDG